MDPSVYDPAVATLFTNLANVAARQSAAAISTKISSIRSEKNDKEAVNKLTDIINDLVRDRDEIISIAQGLKSQLVSQQISENDIKNIVETILPIVKDLIQKNGEEDGVVNAQATLDQVEQLLSSDTLKVLQTLGFNYRKAIGEPLTLLTRNFILSKVEESKTTQEIDLLREQTLNIMARIMEDPDAAPRVLEIRSEFHKLLDEF